MFIQTLCAHFVQIYGHDFVVFLFTQFVVHVLFSHPFCQVLIPRNKNMILKSESLLFGRCMLFHNFTHKVSEKWLVNNRRWELKRYQNETKNNKLCKINAKVNISSCCTDKTVYIFEMRERDGPSQNKTYKDVALYNIARSTLIEEKKCNESNTHTQKRTQFHPM